MVLSARISFFALHYTQPSQSAFLPFGVEMNLVYMTSLLELHLFPKN